MNKFFAFIKEFKIPTKKELNTALLSFDRKRFWLFLGITAVALLTSLIIISKVNNMFLVQVPDTGGQITEGIIGTPTLINPVLALSDADKDMVALVYSGLVRNTPGKPPVFDLASSYDVSTDGLNYTFTLKQDLTFQDGAPLTADDVIFTIEKIKDPLIKSPRKAQWDGVTASKKDDYTVIFALKQPYLSFIDNATIGILPMHIWKNVSATEFSLSSLNIKPVGSGPYQVDSVSKNNDGIPQSYTLKYFKNFVLGAPYIKYIQIISYPNEKELVKALTSHAINQAGTISPENAEEVKKAGYDIKTANLSRIFGLFFNANQNKVLADKSVIQALDKALDRNAIVASVLAGYGTVITNPIPSAFLNIENKTTLQDIDGAKNILEKAGWSLGPDGIMQKGGTKTITVKTKVKGKTVTTTKTVPSNATATNLSFSISTGDAPELVYTANMIREQLATIGVNVTVKVYETGALNNLIRARSYEALFFGQVVNHESDLFAFWDSSQKNDPGLNIALYSNSRVDAILKEVQKINSIEKREQKYKEFANELAKDLPALFIYSPQYLYALDRTAKNINLESMISPTDRFEGVFTWYARTDHVWKLFIK